MKGFIFKLAAIAAVSLVAAVVIRELRKPAKLRRWHGRVAGFVPYDFRRPTGETILRAFWNPYDSRVLTPTAFGIGWAVNFLTLLENMGIFQPDVTEEHFLMPTNSIREALAHVTQGE